MAIFHCSCQVITRGKGHSAVAGSAYRSGEKLTNEYDGLTHNYTYKHGVVYSEVMLCENAPAEYQDRKILWNSVEKIEKHSKAQLAREFEFALPIELTREENIQFARDFVRENIVKYGMCADFAIHDKEDGNPHVHVYTTMRPIEADGSWGAKQRKEYILDKDGNKQYDKKKQTYKCRTIKTTDWDSKEFLERFRENLAGAINKEMEKRNLPQRVDHRSYERQGIDKIPTIHEGKSARMRERKRKSKNKKYSERYVEPTQRIERNKEIRKANKEIAKTERIINEIHASCDWLQFYDKCDKILGKIEKDWSNVELQKMAIAIIPALEDQAFSIAKKQECQGYFKNRMYDNGYEKISYVDLRLRSALNAINSLQAHAQMNLQESGYYREEYEQEVQEELQVQDELNYTEPNNGEIIAVEQPKLQQDEKHSEAEKMSPAQDFVPKTGISSQDSQKSIEKSIDKVQEEPESERTYTPVKIVADEKADLPKTPSEVTLEQLTPLYQRFKELDDQVAALREKKAKLNFLQVGKKNQIDNEILDLQREIRGLEPSLTALGVPSRPIVKDIHETMEQLRKNISGEKETLQIAKESPAMERYKAHEKELSERVQERIENQKAARWSMDDWKGEIADERKKESPFSQPDRPEKGKVHTHGHSR